MNLKRFYEYREDLTNSFDKFMGFESNSVIYAQRISDVIFQLRASTNGTLEDRSIADECKETPIGIFDDFVKLKTFIFRSLYDMF